MGQYQEGRPGLLKRAFNFVFYTEERLGRHNEPFTLPKFRTIPWGLPDPPEDQRLYGIFRGYRNDPRIRGFRKLIKDTHIDDLPQLVWNVIIMRNMTLVSYRPATQEEHDQLPPDLRAERERRKPGCISPWETIGGEITDDKRIEADREYFRKLEEHPVLTKCGVAYKCIGNNAYKVGKRLYNLFSLNGELEP